jgi:hypothetical protein
MHSNKTSSPNWTAPIGLQHNRSLSCAAAPKFALPAWAELGPVFGSPFSLSFRELFSPVWLLALYDPPPRRKWPPLIFGLHAIRNRQSCRPTDIQHKCNPLAIQSKPRNRPPMGTGHVESVVLTSGFAAIWPSIQDCVSRNDRLRLEDRPKIARNRSMHKISEYLDRLTKLWHRPDHIIYLVVHIAIFFVGISLISSQSEIMKAIGTSVVATGVCGWAVFFYIQNTDKHAADRERLRELGLLTGFAARSVPIRPEYERRFNAARKQIDFCGFGLRALREDFFPAFESWLTHARVRVLLIDPTAPSYNWTFADQRDREEGNDHGSIGRDARKFVSSLVALKNKFPDRIDARLYHCSPAINICRVDDEIFWGPYLIGEQSRNSPTFLVGRTGTLFVVLSNHYERIWHDELFSRPAFVVRENGEYSSALEVAALEQRRIPPT